MPVTFSSHLHFLRIYGFDEGCEREVCNILKLLIRKNWRIKMTLEEIAGLVKDEKKTKEEKVRILRRHRLQLLEDIHGMQQLLDQLDYVIHELKKE